MAELRIHLEDNRYKVWMQDFYLEFPAGESNRKVLILLLRSFKRYEGAKQGLFTQEQIAQAIPDFRGATKQSVQDHERRFSESGRDVQGYLNRKRKVDEQVVRVLQEELLADPLASGVELTKRVNARLGRSEVSEANFRAGLEQLPVSDYRKEVRKQLEGGVVSYQEAYLLEQSFSALEESESVGKGDALEVLERARIKVEGALPKLSSPPGSR